MKNRSEAKNPKTPFRLTLRTKIIAWSFVPAAIILGAVALISFTAYQQVTEDLVIERDRELTRLSASQLAAELSEYVDLLAAEARIADIYQGDPDAQRAALERTSNRFAIFDAGVLILDSSGMVAAAEPKRPEILGQDRSDRPYFHQMLDVQGPVFSNGVADGPDGAEVVVVAVPITDERGRLVGVLAGMFRLGATTVSAFYGDILKLRLENSGSAYLVDGQGQVIYHSDPDHVGDDFSAQPVVQQVLSEEVGAVRTRDLDGREIVAGFAPVPGTPWCLVTEESWAVLFGASQGYRQSLLLLLVLGVVVPALVVAIGVRRITRPIAELIGAAQEVAGGNFGLAITAQTGDEIEELAGQFNLMATQLQESYTHLEQRVADRTRELAALNAIAAEASQSLDLDEILNSVLDETLQVTEIEAGGIYLLDEETGTLAVAAQRGFSPQFVAEIDGLEVGEGFSGRVVQTGEPMIIKDVSADPRLTRTAVREEGLRSVAIIPLSSKGMVLGTMFAASRGHREFTDQDVQLLTSISHQIGVAVENARLFKAEQRRAEQFRVIGEVGRHITSILDVDELLAEIVRSLREAFGYYLITIGVIEGDEVVFKAGVKTHWDEPQFRPPPIKVGGRGITAWVAAAGEPILATDVSQEPRFLFLPDAAETRSELAVPLKTKSGVIGVLNVESDRLNAFDESDLAVLQSLAHQAAIAIENARLYEQAQQLAVVEERQRLARELHDAVTQTLFSVGLIAEALPGIWESDPDEARQLLAEMRRLSRGALAEMRTLLMELRPATLVEVSLANLLRQLAEAAAGREDMSIAVSVEGRCELPPDVHVALYRIAQEAMNNVVKHARASRVEICLRCASPRPPSDAGETIAELRVSDDGCSFDPDCVPPGRLGLSIMHERAQDIGATLEIESEPGRGTQITVVWKGVRKGQSDE